VGIGLICLLSRQNLNDLKACQSMNCLQGEKVSGILIGMACLRPRIVEKKIPDTFSSRASETSSSIGVS